MTRTLPDAGHDSRHTAFSLHDPAGLERPARSLGPFDSLDEALATCRKIVDDFLAENYRPRMRAAELLSQYGTFGEGPSIIPSPAPRPFSAWAYAAERVREICGEQ
jgi:hypothetical protein